MLNFSKSIVLLLFLLASERGYAQQQPYCGVQPTGLPAQQASRWHSIAAQSDATAYFNARTLILPTMVVRPHIVRKSDGTGGLSEHDVARAIAGANLYFSDFTIQFIACTPNYIDDDAIYNQVCNYGNITTNTNDSWHPYTTADMIDVFFVENANFNGYGAFPHNSEDWLVFNNNTIRSYGDAVLAPLVAHEFGHYFGLYHTHGDCATNCISYELVDGSNCTTAGDFICDTPADPNLGSIFYPGIMNGCTYTGTYIDNNGNQQNLVDANGDAYTPDVSNIMSYSEYSCRNSFTLDQKNLMLNVMTYHEKRNVFLSTCSCEADLTILSGFYDLDMSFEASSTLVAHNKIAANSDIHYRAGFRITLDKGFAVELGSKFDAKIQTCTTTGQKTIGETLKPYIIADPKNVLTSIAETATNKKGSLLVSPNPFSQQTTIQLELTKSSQTVLTLYTLNGKEILQLEAGQLNAGWHEYQLVRKDLAAGVYLLSLQTEQDRSIQKLIVQ